MRRRAASSIHYGKGQHVPAIAIQDENGKDVLTSDMSGQGLGKDLRSPAALRSLLPVAAIVGTTPSAADGSRDLALTLDSDVPSARTPC
jgi:hypothetical protein